jgi:hypothetical protein
MIFRRVLPKNFLFDASFLTLFADSDIRKSSKGTEVTASPAAAKKSCTKKTA